MKNAHIVIGAGYGDEGKGSTVNLLAQKYPDALNVRFNGGAQAGHTVTLEDGRRHVFSHFGSGSLQGLDTYFNESSIVNPWRFKDEHTVIMSEFGLSPLVFVHENALVTSPYDMAINQLWETCRSGDRHGSCGMGIYETILRSRKPESLVRVHELVYHVFEDINDRYKEYAYRRLQDVRDFHPDCEEFIKDTEKFIDSEDVTRQFFLDYSLFMSMINVVKDDINIYPQYDTVIFEGAQGLQLDQNYVEYLGNLPHATPSNPGLGSKSLHNAFEKYDLTEDNIHVYYLTRFYQTRHGNGPFDREVNPDVLGDIVDLTNIDNPHQGSIRYAPLNVFSLLEAVEFDLQYIDNCRPYLVVTCVDQIVNDEVVIKALHDDSHVKIPFEDLKMILRDNFEFMYGIFYSDGKSMKYEEHLYVAA
ncbi:adenylosuccinate synthetase protein [Rhizobium phage RHph_TM39]|uniref:Adenylosuccinate synthetase protein n=1 Tax=Rhizobium phage RHph_TM30 TaxID=2509764 RepID=A0A7S5R4R6_9CAUD|nr:2-aminooxy adenylosuccinate synthetase [Rhizobium phage RHph_TM30]QIG71126.1 adenylosuccinate synthetase protein [Rhizobium phage RHph_TM30]QIG77007.1 adenylosuccinate synthetase protein [Rhizobium phage RHph_TM39]